MQSSHIDELEKTRTIYLFDMEQIEVMIAQGTIHTVILMMKDSIDDLKNSPRKEQAQPYIDGMTKHVTDLTHSLMMFKHLEKENIALHKLLFNIQKDATEKHYEIKELKQEIEDLKKFI